MIQTRHSLPTLKPAKAALPKKPAGPEVLKKQAGVVVVLATLVNRV
jgi:hypothetical protein